MKAAVLTQPGRIEIKEVPRPEPGPGEVLIRVHLAGVCGSDYSVYRGKMPVPLPVIPGHESVGIVESLGPGVTGLARGRRVTLNPNVACGNCGLCRSGRRNICSSKIRLGLDADGVFAEYVKVPAGYVWPVPEGIPDEIAALTEPLAVARHALNFAAPGPEDQVLIYGAGVIGLMTLLLAADKRAGLSAFDLMDSHLKLAEELGAQEVFSDFDRLARRAVGFDLIFETSGAPDALARAVQLAAPGGRIVLLGLPGQEHPVFTTPIVRKELTIMGSMIYTDEFPVVLDYLSSGPAKLPSLITGVTPLEEIGRVLDDFAAPDRIKILIKI
ncbi:MAG: alcohol dehydrogenase catalytic domain-containing protein [Thermodesulfobacteriota bacterium]